MTVIVMTVPVARRSNIVQPRRDLVLSGNEAATLQVTVMASDAPGAAAMDLSPAGTSFALLLRQPRASLDYGLYPPGGVVVQTVAGGIVNAAAGRVDVAIPARAVAWPQRQPWLLQMTLGGVVTTLARGIINADVAP